MIKNDVYKFFYNNYFKCEIPKNWSVEEDEDCITIYNSNGEGALIISFLNSLVVPESIVQQCCVIAKNFVEQNKILLNGSLLCYPHHKRLTKVFGAGKTTDGWFIDLWVIAKYPRIVLATYQSEIQSSEKKIVEDIIDSIYLE